MGYGAFINSFAVADYHTETANTAITENVAAKDGLRLALLSGSYTCGSTAHSLCFMYAKDAAGHPGSARNTINGTTAAHLLSGQKVIDVDTTPLDPAGNAAAASDVVAYQLTDGTWEFNTIASVSNKAITLTNNIAGVDAGEGGVAIADGSPFLIFGVVGDGAYLSLACPASATTNWGTAAGGSGIVLAHPYVGEPWYVYDANGTAAGFLLNLLFGYINK